MVNIEKEQKELETKKELGITITKAVSTEQLYPSHASLSKLSVKTQEVESNPLAAGRKLEAKANLEKIISHFEDGKLGVAKNILYATEAIRS